MSREITDDERAAADKMFPRDAIAHLFPKATHITIKREVLERAADGLDKAGALLQEYYPTSHHLFLMMAKDIRAALSTAEDRAGVEPVAWRCPKCGAAADERFDCCEVHDMTERR